jgi:leucyl aminopeptidase
MGGRYLPGGFMHHIHRIAISFLTVLISVTSLASSSHDTRWPILTDIKLLQAVGITPVSVDYVTGTAYAVASVEQRNIISEKAHEWGRCAGFELLINRESPNYVFGRLQMQQFQNLAYMRSDRTFGVRLDASDLIKNAVAEVKQENIRNTVIWLSSYPDRYNRGEKPNAAIEDAYNRISAMASKANFPVKVDLIDHRSTPQKSIRVHIEGKSRPSEIVVLGAHIDSINQGWSGSSRLAPGADDNASGTGDLIEAFRILLEQQQPDRSVEIFWYAGEESGLLGSAEIAADYASNKRDVVGVLQLDMTLMPGEGEFVLGSMQDFTSAWLRDRFIGLNQTYIGAKIKTDECGYGCSDHASWYRNGYPTLMPFEATMRTMNHNLHTEKDVIDNRSDFSHSAMFAKIAVAFAMDLANSTDREPKSRQWSSL